MGPTTDYDYIALGHITVDVRAETGRRTPGGSALYSGLQAARLGLRTLIVTAGDRDEIEPLLAPYRNEFDLVVQPRPQTTTFVTEGIGELRRQQLAAWAGEMSDPGELDAAIVHVAPVARETGPVATAPGTFVGVTPQGLVRRWDDAGEPSHVALDSRRLPRLCNAIVLDQLELTFAAATVATAVRDGVVVAVTAADDGVELLTGDASVRLPALAPVALVEDLGAGDVFAAAFFVALRDGVDPVSAANFGQAAACLRLAARGPAAVADRAAILGRLRVLEH
jgi:sugar/nucleoside kinase (ribokinase family)